MPFNSTLASTALESRVESGQELAETCEDIRDRRIPNFFRLFLNPFVVRTCLCLSHYVRSTWFADDVDRPAFPSFLANSFDEALSGAIKLARFSCNLGNRPAAGLLVDPDGRLGQVAFLSLRNGTKIELIPNLLVAEDERQLEEACDSRQQFGFIVVAGSLDSLPLVLRKLLREQSPSLIACVDRASLASFRNASRGVMPEFRPDIVVFDESFVNHQVPFAAFTARRDLFDHWNKPGRAAFHSTTFQPNTIASLHFLRCLQQADPGFHDALAPELGRIGNDGAWCASLMARLYNPFLVKAIGAFGFDTPGLHAAGHYIVAGDRKIFDGVAGIACSMRGHNPPSYLQELEKLDECEDCRQAVTQQLADLTGLQHLVPAVSGATAVENALRLGLAAQSPKSYVVAFKGGFGGKTLLSLTGTAEETYKEHLDPLYEKVIYIDPFSPSVLQDLESTLTALPVAIVQLELIQAVGGVRSIPADVIDWLAEHRTVLGYLLFIDEVQTGMYRTGPFTMSKGMGIKPDLLTLGKGTSDMMFPFALTMYSTTIQQRLDEMQPQLVESIDENYDYEFGFRTVLSTLQRAQREELSARVAAAGELFGKLLGESLATVKIVRDVRVHGLLIAIELDGSRWPQRLIGKRFPLFYLLALVQDKAFPLLMGYCQYEPGVLKLTPPLTITTDEIHQVCSTIARVLRRPFVSIWLAGLVKLAASFLPTKWQRDTKVVESLGRDLPEAGSDEIA
jgi:acetylornithine/succinyldiaminopimelate/putrescine aminotransferase